MQTEPLQNSSAADFILSRIQNVYAERKAANPLYSLRAFARDLGISQSLLTLLFQKKRRLTQKQFEKISSLLHFSKQEVSRGVQAIRHQKARVFVSPEPLTDSVLNDIRYLEVENFKVIAQWYHLPIVALASTEGFKADPKWIAKRIGITQPEAATALERLIQLGLLGEAGEALKKPLGTHARFNPTRASSATRSYHLQILDKVKTTLDQTSTDAFERRSIRGLSLAVDAERLAEAKAELERFEQSFAKKFTQGNPTEVYQLNLQFFPLTQSLERTKK